MSEQKEICKQLCNIYNEDLTDYYHSLDEYLAELYKETIYNENGNQEVFGYWLTYIADNARYIQEFAGNIADIAEKYAKKYNY